MGFHLSVDRQIARGWPRQGGQGGRQPREAGEAEEGRGLLRQKPPINPLTVWRSSDIRSSTFREAVQAHLARNERAWKNDKHRAQWRSTLLGSAELNYCKKILDVPCEQITTRDLLDVLAPIWGRAPETASRLRGRIEVVLDAERALRVGRGDANDSTWRNPAQWRGNLEPLLPKKTKQAKALGSADTSPRFPMPTSPPSWRVSGPRAASSLGRSNSWS